MSETKKIAFYLGCALPSAQLFAEAAAKMALKDLGVEPLDIEGATCCPDPEISRTVAPELWISMAGRNIALAEQMDVDVFTVCNGCYDTLTHASHMLKEDKELYQKVNDNLSKIGIKYKGNRKVLHAIELLYDVIGVNKIKSSLKRKLTGVRVNIQYGCRIRLNPKKELVRKFKELVEALGCEVISLDTDRICCGVPMMYSDQQLALEQTKKRLDDMKKHNIDCVAVFCPACYDRLEKGQLELNQKGEDYNIPILNYFELLAYCLGHDPDDFGAYLHKLDYQKVFEKAEEGGS
ncbi:MAG: CoB--CoM heterodisulfide reductase iron-sulfur subunit B family protein [Candidatus Odinarchaeia archaeon]